MGATSISSAYLASCLVLPVVQAQSQLAEATTEESTGVWADIGAELGEQSGYELSLKEQIDQLNVQTTANSITATSLSNAQAALTTISSSASTTAQALTEWTANSSATTNLKTIGEQALAGLVSSANTASGGAYVFGGINTSTAPMTDYSSTSAFTAQFDADFKAAFGCLPSDAAAADIAAAQMQSFLGGTFASYFSGSNWSNWSSASSTNTTASIAPGQIATTSTNANTTGFKDLTQGYAMLALFGGSSLGSSAMQAVVSAATTLVTAGQSAITGAAAALGQTQSQVTDANGAMSSQLTLIQTQVNALDEPNQTALSAKITALTNQIQMAYELTNRLHALNLAQYLPVS